MKRFLSFLLAMMILFALPGCGGNKETAEDTGMNWQEQYDLGIRYLSEGNYEEAIIAFTAAIEIDPKRVDAYVSLADVYVELGDMENAMAILESGYAETGDEALREYLDMLTGGSKPPQEEQNLGPHGETVFESRKHYQEYASLTEEQMAFVDEMIAALQAADREALTALALRFVPLFERHEVSTFSTLKTKNDTYKIHATIQQNSPDNRWWVVQIRPETGMGYHAEIQPESWYNPSDPGIAFSPWTYAACPCVDWQPEGDFIQESESYQNTYDGTTHGTTTASGTAAGGVILTHVTYGKLENLTTGEVNEHTSEGTYENGHRVFADGPSESFWTPFSGPGSTPTDLDWIFW